MNIQKEKCLYLFPLKTTIMASETFIDFSLDSEDGGCDGMQLLHNMLDWGWEYGLDSKVMYMLGSPDDADWETGSIAELDNILAKLKGSFAKQERVEIFMGWKHTDLAVNVIFAPPYSNIMFDVSAGKRLENEERITDLNWYIERLILPVGALGLRIASITCQQFF